MLLWLLLLASSCSLLTSDEAGGGADKTGVTGESAPPATEPFMLDNGVIMNPKPPPPPSRVEHLTLTTLDWKISNGSDWFIKFYGPHSCLRLLCVAATAYVHRGMLLLAMLCVACMLPPC